MNFEAIFTKVEPTKWSCGIAFLDACFGMVCLAIFLPYCLSSEEIPVLGLQRIYLSEEPIFYWAGIACLIFMGVGGIVSSWFTYKNAVNEIKHNKNT